MAWEEIVGSAIRKFRLSRELTIEELALSAQVDPRYLGSIERGRGNPSVAVLGRLANALHVHPSAFFQD
jgi:transcriptional regulator with XRE-family HTH domain